MADQAKLEKQLAEQAKKIDNLKERRNKLQNQLAGAERAQADLEAVRGGLLLDGDDKAILSNTATMAENERKKRDCDLQLLELQRRMRAEAERWVDLEGQRRQAVYEEAKAKWEAIQVLHAERQAAMRAYQQEYNMAQAAATIAEQGSLSFAAERASLVGNMLR